MRQPWLRKHELSGSGPVGRKDKCAMNAPTRPARRGRKTRSDDTLPAQLDWREIRNHMAHLSFLPRRAGTRHFMLAQPSPPHAGKPSVSVPILTDFPVVFPPRPEPV